MMSAKFSDFFDPSSLSLLKILTVGPQIEVFLYPCSTPPLPPPSAICMDVISGWPLSYNSVVLLRRAEAGDE